MKKISSLCFVFALCATTYTQAQNVGIGASAFTPNATAGLDITFTNRGLLIPRVSLTATNSTTPIIATPAASLLVYNTATTGVAPNNVTPGYYYWEGTTWVRFFTGNEAWATTGNRGTAIATNFLGTIDNVPFAMRTNNIERMRITGGAAGAGQVVINSTTPFTDDMFSSYANATRNTAVSGYGTFGVYGEATSQAGVYGSATTGVGVYGVNNSTNTGAVSGYNSNVASGIGGIFAGNNQSGVLLGVGAGITANGSTVGVYGEAVSGAALYGQNTQSNTGFATVTAKNTHANGVGGNFIGNNVATTVAPTAGCGLTATGTRYGLAAYSTLTTSISAGGYFQLGSAGTYYSYVALNNGGTNYKIYGSGSVSTIVKDLNNKVVTMFCPEAPEILFQDFGKGELNNGVAHINLDPIFTKNIKVDDKHPLRVFVQLEGDCNGVYIANKTANSFDVKELQNGTSNVAFTWFVTANRIDDVNPETGEMISKHEGVRFPAGLGPLESKPASTLAGSEIKESKKIERTKKEN